jgi:hypothetical protein
MGVLMVCAGAAGFGGGDARAAEAARTITASSGGYIHDAFAVSADGKSIAWIETDGASAATMFVGSVDAAQAQVSIGGVPPDVAALYFLDDKRLLVVARAGEAAFTAQAWTAAGAAGPKLGPAQHVALATVAGKPAVVTYSKQERRGGAEHVLVAYARDTLKPIARRTLKEDAEGRVPHPTGALKLLWWRDGFSSAAVLQAGGFDKERDMRRPDRFARLDPWGAKPEVLEPSDITDVLGFAEVSMLHGRHGPDGLFVTVTEDRKALLLVDGLAMSPITLPRPLAIYDADQFAWQRVDGDDARLWLSATVDPTNPEALARKKADRDDLTLFAVERATRALKKVLEVPGQNRPTAWRIGGDTMLLLRKSKGFGRGGVALEVWRLNGAGR